MPAASRSSRDGWRAARKCVLECESLRYIGCAVLAVVTILAPKVGEEEVVSSGASSCGTGLRAARLPPGPPAEEVLFIAVASNGGLAGIAMGAPSMERRGTGGERVRGEAGEAGTEAFPSS